jgi:dCTP diphosphatase
MTDSIDQLRKRVNQFVEERDWSQFHSPKNLAMAMIVEAGEVVEHFQWMTEAESGQLNTQKKSASWARAVRYVYLLIADCRGVRY